MNTEQWWNDTGSEKLEYLEKVCPTATSLPQTPHKLCWVWTQASAVRCWWWSNWCMTFKMAIILSYVAKYRYRPQKYVKSSGGIFCIVLQLFIQRHVANVLSCNAAVVTSFADVLYYMADVWFANYLCGPILPGRVCGFVKWSKFMLKYLALIWRDTEVKDGYVCVEGLVNLLKFLCMFICACCGSRFLNCKECRIFFSLWNCTSLLKKKQLCKHPVCIYKHPKILSVSGTCGVCSSTYSVRSYIHTYIRA